ncbi:hypothetical protein GA0115249_111715 [Streptomyces sp. PpalLS-921]|nr:hypothetical protein YUMDRAFT_04867 [Streptomyces sp. OspMP-M45]SCD98259.1 hypothetical protein GA0115249_111715 [Streptomyces sp. PpalLS-921]
MTGTGRERGRGPGGARTRLETRGRRAAGGGCRPGRPGVLSVCGGAQPSSWATARRASASSTPQLISCSVSTDGDWS